MTTVITISNHKGGVGKTTTAAHLGHALALMGKNVLLVDFDPQASLTAFFSMSPSDAASYLLTLGLGAGETTLLKSMVRDVREHLTMLPASVGLSGAQAQMNASGKSIDWARRALERFFRHNLHYVIIDTNPSASGIQERAVWAADLLIVPTQAEWLSISGMANMMNMVKTLNSDFVWQGRLLGILPTMVRGNDSHFMLREHRASLEDVRQSFGSLLLPVIPDRAIVKECPAHGKTLFEIDQDNHAALAYQQVAKLIRSAS